MSGSDRAAAAEGGPCARQEPPVAGGRTAPARLGAQMTLRAILALYPQTAEVFARHGLMGCGGPEGPEEPLDLFARAHHVDLAALLAELHVAAAAPPPRPAEVPPPAPVAAPAQYRRFIATSLGFALSFGAVLGVLLLATLTLPHNFLAGLSAAGARTAHAHAQVFGFTALFIMGVAFHAVPRMKSAPLAAPHLATAVYWLQAGGVLLIAVGALAGTPLGSATECVGAAALVGAALAFAISMRRTLASGARSAEGFEPWLDAGSVWLVVAALLTLAAAAGTSALQPAVWEAALYGFAASWILGFSLRILPAFMGITPAPRWRGAVCAAYQIGVATWVGAAVLQAWGPLPAPLRALAGGCLTAAGIAVVWRLGIFGARQAPQGTADRGFERFVVAAYGWLLVALLCAPAWSAASALRGVPMPALVLDFGRHALTLGFLSQMIVGISTRIIPVFSGRALWGPRWRAATFYLLNAAVVVRSFQVVVMTGGPVATWPWIAASGPLALGAFVSYALILAMTLNGRGAALPRTAGVAREPSDDSLIADLLAIPGALDLLVAHGFTPLRNPTLRAAMASTITLRQACRLRGIAVEPLVVELRGLARPSDPPQSAAPRDAA